MSIAADRDTGSTSRPACDTEAMRARRAKLEASPVTCRCRNEDRRCLDNREEGRFQYRCHVYFIGIN